MTVDLGLTADQEAIAELFDGFFTKESPTTVARAAEPLGFDRELWDKLVELGAPGMGSDEAVGGGGAALSDLVVVAESLGRAIAPVPLVDHLAALTVLDDADLVAGEAVAAVSVRPADADGNWWLVPAGAVADVVVGVDGDELVAVRSAPPMTGPLNHASAPARRPLGPRRRPPRPRPGVGVPGRARPLEGAHRRGAGRHLRRRPAPRGRLRHGP